MFYPEGQGILKLERGRPPVTRREEFTNRMLRECLQESRILVECACCKSAKRFKRTLYTRIMRNGLSFEEKGRTNGTKHTYYLENG
uniref:Uncharacterized protein n=1 Tax=Megaselia scalaris TaxID=36166 RepID=T1H3V9_MEGSC